MISAIRTWCYQHGLRWHAQNLNELPGDRLGPMWRHGRAWINLWRGNGDTGKGYRELLEVNPEWLVAERWSAAALELQLGGESDTELMLHVEVPGVSLFLTVDPRFAWCKRVMERVLPGYWCERGTYRHFPEPGPERFKVSQETEISVRWFEGGLWWSLWHPTMEWSSKTPRWRHGHWDPIDSLLGRDAYSSVDIRTEDVVVPMPEHGYAAKVRLFESTWRRPRWPLARRLLRAEIAVEGGIPHPGKGENSWDCGDDATYSLTCQARTAEEAVGHLVASVLRSRTRYGGRDWRPSEVAA
jgi:hypothetical protein